MGRTCGEPDEIELTATGVELNGSQVAESGVGTVRFVGLHPDTGKPRVGVELDDPTGKHAGTVKGHVFFACEAKHGVVAKPGNVSKISTDATGSEAPKGPPLPGTGAGDDVAEGEDGYVLPRASVPSSPRALQQVRTARRQNRAKIVKNRSEQSAHSWACRQPIALYYPTLPYRVKKGSSTSMARIGDISSASRLPFVVRRCQR